MKDIIIISMSLAIALGGCTRSINPEYEPFIEELERTDRIYDLSNASDSNICRLAELVDNVIGKIVVFVIALCLLSLNVLSGAIGLIAAYVLVHRSERTTGSSAKRVYVPTETKKAKHLAAMNDFPVTVEEEVINNMLPVTNRVYSSPGYKPVLDSFHDSAEI